MLTSGMRLVLKGPYPLVYISVTDCHYFCFSFQRFCISCLALLFFLFEPALPAQTASAVQPNQSLSLPRPDAPPPHVWNISAEAQEAEGKVYKLHGKAEIESTTMLFRADDIEFKEETGDLRATGNVFFQNVSRKEKFWASRVESNTESETGKFYKVHGETSPHIAARPGILTTSNPFYFEGEWAERIEDKYVLPPLPQSRKGCWWSGCRAAQRCEERFRRAL